MEEYTLMALDVAKAQAGVRNMTEEEIGSMIENVANRLRNIDHGQSVTSDPYQGQTPAVDPKKALREKSVICLECGRSFKMLSKKHLMTHGLTPEAYKEKWGYKKNQSLVARALSRARRKKMQEIQIWKKKETGQA